MKHIIERENCKKISRDLARKRCLEKVKNKPNQETLKMDKK